MFLQIWRIFLFCCGVGLGTSVTADAGAGGNGKTAGADINLTKIADQYLGDCFAGIEETGATGKTDVARSKFPGVVELRTSITSDGVIESVKVLQSSGHKTLDRVAVDRVKAVRSCPPFPPELKAAVDVIDWDRIFAFMDAKSLADSGIPNAERVAGARRDYVSAVKPGIYRTYVDACLKRLVAVINEHYPEEARGRLYGKGIATVAVWSSGHLNHVELDRSTGQEILDDAILNLIWWGESCEPFPPEMREQIEIIFITFPFEYSQ